MKYLMTREPCNFVNTYKFIIVIYFLFQLIGESLRKADGLLQAMDLLVGRMIYLLSFNSNLSSRFNFHIGHSIEVEIASVLFIQNGSEVKFNS